MEERATGSVANPTQGSGFRRGGGKDFSRVRVWNQVLAAKFKAEQEIDIAEQKAAEDELKGKADGSQSARTPRKTPTEKSSPERSVRDLSPSRSPKAFAAKREEKMRKQLE